MEKNVQYRYLYNDNTLTKSTMLSKKRVSLYKAVLGKQQALEKLSKASFISKRNFLIASKWEQITKTQIKQYKNFQIQMTQAALLIQKFIRGYLTRTHTDRMLLAIEESKSCIASQELENHIKKLYVRIKIITEPAAIKIQRAYKAYIFRKKIKGLGLDYVCLKQKKSQFSEFFIKKFLVQTSNRLRLFNIIFDSQKSQKILEIRKKLSILTIKKYWKAKHLNLKKIKEKIQKYKRKKSLLVSKEKYIQYLENFNGYKRKESKNSHKSSSSSNSETSIEGHYRKTEKLKQMVMKKINEKVSKSKVSYSVESLKNKMILPIMGERQMFLSKLHNKSKLFEVTLCSKMKSIRANKEIKVPIRKTTIFSPIKVNSKRYFGPTQANTPALIYQSVSYSAPYNPMSHKKTKSSNHMFTNKIPKIGKFTSRYNSCLGSVSQCDYTHKASTNSSIRNLS